MKKLITLDDDFYASLKKSFLPYSQSMNDMAFLRYVLQYAKLKADESKTVNPYGEKIATKKKNHRSP